ncbi:MAG: hypothetical protein JO305_03565 [Alphaproteobacteria bacterium]|nr:hypothetical protein [Alphaproteobacteria bacterium]
MTECEIIELAAILVTEHGDHAVRFAEERRAEHDRQRASDAYRLWDSIAVATARLVSRRSAGTAA